MLTLSNGIGATGWPEVRSMQEALVALSQVTGNVVMNPGTPNGFVDSRTINAVVASMNVIGKFIGGTTAGLLQAGLAIASIADPERAKGLILQYARQIEQGARAASLAYVQGGQVPAPPAVPGLPPGFPMPGAVPWYKTWWGIGAIAVGGVGVLAILFAPPRRAAAA